MKSIIEAKKLSIGYNKPYKDSKGELYNDLNFSLNTGELTCLLGINGAGKSTLLRTISALQPPLAGCVEVDGCAIETYSEQDLSRIMGLVLTDKVSVGGLTVYELVALGRYPYTGFWGRLSTADKAIVQKAMDDVGITYKSRAYVAELSDGERQKVMIAKSLAQECPIVILDEPTAFLDVTSRIEIMNLLHNIATTHNKAILLSTHDIELALNQADKLWLLSPQYGLMCGATEDIVLSGKISAFLGEENIAFNQDTGNFSIRRTYRHSIFVNSKDKHYHWVKNFMERNGFTIASEPNNADLCLKVDAPDSILYIEKGTEYRLSSFAELREKLKIYISE